MRIELHSVQAAVARFAVALLLPAFFLFDHADTYAGEADSIGIRKTLYACVLADLDAAKKLLPPLPAVSYVRGRTEHALGQFDRAVAAYDKTIELKPTHMQATRCREAAHKGLACKVAINPYPLTRAWDTAPSKLPAFTKPWEQWMRNHIKVVHPDLTPKNSEIFAWKIGRRYMAKGALDTALFLFNEDLRVHPDSPLSLLGRAHVLSARARQSEAIADFTKIIDLLLKDAHGIMAKVAPYRGRKITSAISLELMKYYWPGTLYDVFEMLMDSYVARAVAHEKRGQLTQALADYQRVLQIVPGHAVVSFSRNKLLTRIQSELSGRADDAVSRTMEDVARSGNPFAGLTELYPSLAARNTDINNGRYRLDLMRRYMERGLHEVAVAFLLHWAHREDRLRAARFSLHGLYSAMGDYENALKVLDTFIAANLPSPNFRMERAAVYAALRQFDLAVSDLTVDIDSGGEYFEIFHQRARVYAETGAFDRAIEDMKSINPATLSNKPILKFDMARFYAMNTDYLMAARWATKAIALAPEFARAYELRALAHFFQATVQPPRQALQDRWNGCTPPQE